MTSYFPTLWGFSVPFLGERSQHALLRFSVYYPFSRACNSIRFIVNHEKPEDHVFTKDVPDFLAINIGLALRCAAMSGYDKDFRIWLTVFDKLNPFLHMTLLDTFAWLPDDEVNCGGTKKQLMCGSRQTRWPPKSRELLNLIVVLVPGVSTLKVLILIP